MSFISSLVLYASSESLAPRVKKALKTKAKNPVFEKMTKAELMEYASNKGIEVFKSWTNKKMIEALNA